MRMGNSKNQLNKLVKTLSQRWLSIYILCSGEKLHIRGTYIFYYFGVLEHFIMVENSQQRRRWRVFATLSV